MPYVPGLTCLCTTVQVELRINHMRGLCLRLGAQQACHVTELYAKYYTADIGTSTLRNQRELNGDHRSLVSLGRVRVMASTQLRHVGARNGRGTDSYLWYNRHQVGDMTNHTAHSYEGTMPTNARTVIMHSTCNRGPFTVGHRCPESTRMCMEMLGTDQTGREGGRETKGGRTG